MPLRLVVQLPQRVLKIPLAAGELVVGSAAECDVVLGHPTVSRRHARLVTDGETSTIDDLGSSNGTRLDERRVDQPTALVAGHRLSFGSVAARIESVRAGDLEPAVALDTPDDAALPETTIGSDAEPPARRRTTLSASALEGFLLHHLPRLLIDVRSGAAADEVARELGAALFGLFPILDVEIAHGTREPRAVWFQARSDSPVTTADEVERLEHRDGSLTIRAAVFPPGLATTCAPVIDAGLHLLAIAARAERPPSPRPAASPPPLPRPTSVEPTIRRIYGQAAQIARGDIGVLIQGESGTGKEVLARYLHTASGRPEQRYVALNCAALPRDLLEAELFGIEDAVATGVAARAGKFEQADDGTLFLDEIGDMALETQAKILRVLQEQEVYRLGGKQPHSANVRVLAATNRDVDAMVRGGRFRSDLYHRIASWTVTLPPLRDRRADIANLAAHFLAAEARRRDVVLAGLSRSALDALLAWDWPGNIRELQHEIARASLFLGPDELLESGHLREAIRDRLDRPEPTLKEILESTERRHIEQALSTTGGDTTAAAERLGIGRSTLYRRMKALDVQEPVPVDPE